MKQQRSEPVAMQAFDLIYLALLMLANTRLSVQSHNLGVLTLNVKCTICRLHSPGYALCAKQQCSPQAAIDSNTRSASSLITSSFETLASTPFIFCICSLEALMHDKKLPGLIVSEADFCDETFEAFFVGSNSSRNAFCKKATLHARSMSTKTKLQNNKQAIQKCCLRRSLTPDDLYLLAQAQVHGPATSG